MDKLQLILNNLQAGFRTQELTTTAILAVLVMVTVMAVYEFCIYRFVSKRSFYAKQFNIALAVLPYFIATIIMTLQSNLVITLGTIGALAIIRFRTAVKDPIDMVYLLWSVHTGITVGCGLYEVAILTSLVVTILLIVLDLLPMTRAPYLLVAHMEKPGDEKVLLEAVREFARSPRVKSRSFSAQGLDLIVELRCTRCPELAARLSELPELKRFSLIAHDSEDVIH